MQTTNSKPHLVIVTGLSGAGKSTVIKAFEDINYFCIDNLPVPLLPPLLDLCSEKMQDVSRIALGIDVRERSFLGECESVFSKVKNSGYLLEIIFVEASPDVIQRRYSQTRRVHPLEYVMDDAERNKRLVNAIEAERKLLTPLRQKATRIIDTSDFTVHNLKSLIVHAYRNVPDRDLLSIQVMSFGYKFGVPLEADIVMDVRFLPNPYFDDNLRDLTGCDHRVNKWVMNCKETREFLGRMESLLDFLIPHYLREGKRYLTLAFGCTGGKHRSVVIAEYFHKRFKAKDYYSSIFHRDINRE